MNVQQMTAEIMTRSKSLSLNCDQTQAEELAGLIAKAYEESARDLAVEMLIESIKELRASM
jgi:hypothetical protein